MQDFVARHDLDHVEHIADVDGSVWARNDIPGQPAWIFIDGETGTKRTTFGALGAEGLSSEIEALAS